MADYWTQVLASSVWMMDNLTRTCGVGGEVLGMHSIEYKEGIPTFL